MRTSPAPARDAANGRAAPSGVTQRQRPAPSGRVTCAAGLTRAPRPEAWPEPAFRQVPGRPSLLFRLGGPARICLFPPWASKGRRGIFCGFRGVSGRCPARSCSQCLSSGVGGGPGTGVARAAGTGHCLASCSAPSHSRSPPATRLAICPSFCSSSWLRRPGSTELGGSSGFPRLLSGHHGTRWLLTWMVLVLGDPVFSFPFDLCCVLGKPFLALSEPLWSAVPIKSHSVDPPQKVCCTMRVGLHLTPAGQIQVYTGSDSEFIIKCRFLPVGWISGFS